MELTSFEVIDGDVIQTPCDVLVLKFAQSFYGADRAVANALKLDAHEFSVDPGDHLLLPTSGKLACKNVLFVGVPSLPDFGYAEIRSFASRATFGPCNDRRRAGICRRDLAWRGLRPGRA